MAQEKRDSTRNLLEQLEGGWDEDDASGDDPQKEPSAPQSAPSLDELDAKWGDDLFGDDEEDEEEEEQEEPEPELPDERADPVAYAEAKKAREERVEARRKKKKAKLDAKRAKKRARIEAVQKQKKQKSKKSRAPVQREATPKDDESAADETAPSSEARPKSTRADVATIERKKKAPPWKILALVLVVLLGAAGLVSVILGRR
jgi:cobalamin biosynthesis Mg chelatase CobN